MNHNARNYILSMLAAALLLKFAVVAGPADNARPVSLLAPFAGLIGAGLAVLAAAYFLRVLGDAGSEVRRRRLQVAEYQTRIEATTTDLLIAEEMSRVMEQYRLLAPDQLKFLQRAPVFRFVIGRVMGEIDGYWMVELPYGSVSLEFIKEFLERSQGAYLCPVGSFSEASKYTEAQTLTKTLVDEGLGPNARQPQRAAQRLVGQ